jgi:hypothetical protein
MKKHLVYLFKQVTADHRVVIARWSPTITRNRIRPFHSQDDQSAIDYLNYFGWPVIEQFAEPLLIPALPFESIEVEDDVSPE